MSSAPLGCGGKPKSKLSLLDQICVQLLQLEVDNVPTLEEAINLVQTYTGDPIACKYCNGYYGNVFGSPVCPTCHEFLCFRPDAVPAVNQPKQDEGAKSDSEDSGNEDPEPEQRAPEMVVASPSTSSQRSMSNRVQSDSSTDNDATPPVAVPANANHPIGNNNGPSIGEQLQLLHHRDRMERQVHALSNYSAQCHGSLEDGVFESRLPPELLSMILPYLDDVALCSAAFVNRRWRKLVLQHSTSSYWRRRIERRWPLLCLKSLSDRDTCWLRLFVKLLRCSTCVSCMTGIEHEAGAWCTERRANSPTIAAALRHDASNDTRRLRSEWRRIMQEDCPDGVAAVPLKESLHLWMGSITGPHGTPYEGGQFFLVLLFPDQYPLFPPAIRFVTRIVHPNVSEHGEIGLDILTISKWAPHFSITKLLVGPLQMVSIRSLLSDPHVLTCMRADVGQMYQQRPGVYRALAQLATHKYACLPYAC